MQDGSPKEQEHQLQVVFHREPEMHLGTSLFSVKNKIPKLSKS